MTLWCLFHHCFYCKCFAVSFVFLEVSGVFTFFHTFFPEMKIMQESCGLRVPIELAKSWAAGPLDSVSVVDKPFCVTVASIAEASTFVHWRILLISNNEAALSCCQSHESKNQPFLKSHDRSSLKVGPPWTKKKENEGLAEKMPNMVNIASDTRKLEGWASLGPNPELVHVSNFWALLNFSACSTSTLLASAQPPSTNTECFPSSQLSHLERSYLQPQKASEARDERRSRHSPWGCPVEPHSSRAQPRRFSFPPSWNLVFFHVIENPPNAVNLSRWCLGATEIWVLDLTVLVLWRGISRLHGIKIHIHFLQKTSDIFWTLAPYVWVQQQNWNWPNDLTI